MNQSAATAKVKISSPLANYYRWVEPDSDITACLKLDTVDRLQLQVLESASHAGHEVGGILLGRTETDEGRTQTFVDEFVPVPCERRNGSHYALSAKDALAFETVLDRYAAGSAPRVVGFYRSHNRGGLFLSAEDLSLIHRHFPGPENVFLLVKTLPNRACTAGFFFWKDGRIQSEFTDSEAPLIPVALSVTDDPATAPAASAHSPAAPGRSRGLRRLVLPLAITGVAAAVTLAVVHYRETPPAPVSTTGVPAAPAPIRVPAIVAQQIAPVVPSAPAQAVQHRNEAAIPVREEPQPPPSPVSEMPPAAPPAAADPGLQPAPKPVADTVPLPLITAPVTSASAPDPPPQVGSPPPAERPATPLMIVPPAEPKSRELPAAPAPAPPVSSTISPPNAYVGPRVIHQATPAVPRGVGPMITTGVEVDVEVSIDVKGKVTAARLSATRGAAAGLLTIEALKAAQLFRFQPAQENHRNVASSMVLTFRFAQPKPIKE